jgi:hypothetical protein
MNHKHHIKQIRKTLEKHSPKATKKAKSIFKFKYPKIFFMLLAVIIAYFIFKNPISTNLTSNLNQFNYLGDFVAGMFFALGFSAPFAIGFFVISHPENIFLSAVIGAIGASISDLLIFKFMKFSFANEFKELRKTKALKKIKEIFDYSFKIRVRHYLLYAFAGVIIATPLPDEIGVSMLAGLTTIKQKVLLVISFILHLITILIIFKVST